MYNPDSLDSQQNFLEKHTVNCDDPCEMEDQGELQDDIDDLDVDLVGLGDLDIVFLGQEALEKRPLSHNGPCELNDRDLHSVYHHKKHQTTGHLKQCSVDRSDVHHFYKGRHNLCLLYDVGKRTAVCSEVVD